MRFNIPGLVVAAFVLAACSSTGEDSANTGSTGASSASSGGNQTATAPTGPKPGSQMDLEVNIGDRVFFDFDKSNLSPEARTSVERWAAWLKTYPANKVVVEGHADEQGTREYNVALGARRANAAREYLVSRGISGNRLRTVSYGKERPIEVCSQEACYAKNRRAVTVLAGGLSS